MIHKYKKSLCPTVVITTIFLFVINLVNSATFVWDENTGDITGYRLHYGTEPRNNSPYSKTLNVGEGNLATIDATIENLQPGKYYAAVTAYNSAGESGYSNEVEFTVSGDTPSDVPVFRLIRVTLDGTTEDRLVVYRGQPGDSVVLETSENLINWNPVNVDQNGDPIIDQINQTGVYNYLLEGTNNQPPEYFRVRNVN